MVTAICSVLGAVAFDNETHERFAPEAHQSCGKNAMLMTELAKQLAFADGVYSGRAVLPCWERSVRVEIAGSAGGLTNIQRDNLRALVEWPRSIRPSFQAAVAEYYREHVFDTFEDENGDPPEEVPPLRDDQDIWGLLGEETTFVLRDVEEEEALPCFDVLVECKWDEEHGLCVSFDQGAVIDVG